tara:strand:+ start:349 stop:1185 length:837 start_codon:yes stop_codon:yes gene_type:complete
MTRRRHNKKRNTAFLYEALIREMTKAVVSKDDTTKQSVVHILKEFFAPHSVLSKELSLYQTLSDTDDLDPITAEKLVYQVREAHSSLNKKDVYNTQSRLIKKINTQLSPGVYNNFVPNYKSIATLSQLFGSDNDTYNIKKGVILEQQIVANLTNKNKSSTEQEMKPIDNLVFATFVSKFNDTYSEGLLNEQKELLNRYILSFSDNGIDVKIYLNEEISRLQHTLASALDTEEIKSDDNMKESVTSVLAMIEEFKTTPVDKELIEKVLKIQNVAHEIEA